MKYIFIFIIIAIMLIGLSIFFIIGNVFFLLWGLNINMQFNRMIKSLFKMIFTDLFSRN